MGELITILTSHSVFSQDELRSKLQQVSLGDHSEYSISLAPPTMHTLPSGDHFGSNLSMNANSFASTSSSNISPESTQATNQTPISLFPQVPLCQQADTQAEMYAAISQGFDPASSDYLFDRFKTHQDPNQPRSNTFQDDIFNSGWPREFPAPTMAFKLISTFFEKSPLMSCMFQPSLFFEQVLHGPKSSSFPSKTCLHAIFAMAYILQPDLDPSNQFKEGEIANTLAMKAARLHGEKAKHHLMQAALERADLLSTCKGALVLGSVKFGLGDMLDAWLVTGIAARLAMSLRLNRAEDDLQMRKGQVRVDLISATLIHPPQNWSEEEERRRIMATAFLS